MRRDAARAALVARTATVGVAALAAVALGAAPGASAAVSPVGESVSTTAASGPWELDATCHFGPTTDHGGENRLYVQGVATAPGAVATALRCVVESGNGVWSTTYETDDRGPVAVVAGDDWLWTAEPDRVCVEAAATFVDGTVLRTPRVCA